jgi:hypothetical protein
MEARLGDLITEADAKEILKEALSQRFVRLLSNLIDGYAGTATDRLKAEDAFSEAVRINLSAISFATTVLEEKIKEKS